MENHTLFSIFSSFDGADGKEEKLIPQFSNMARYLLSGGYFLVNNERKIYLTDIEFYYHEEGADGKKIKDPIMYHTYDHEKNTKALKSNNNKLPYLPIGSLNTHVSGIDVTFENEAKQYRASFLIRGYKRGDRKKPEIRSTQIYEDFFMGFSLSENLTLEWRTEGDLCSFQDIVSTVRLRVPAYQKDSEGNYQTDLNGNYIKVTATNEDENDTTMSFKGSNNIIYKQCDRKWRFQKIKKT